MCEAIKQDIENAVSNMDLVKLIGKDGKVSASNKLELEDSFGRNSRFFVLRFLDPSTDLVRLEFGSEYISVIRLSTRLSVKPKEYVQFVYLFAPYRSDPFPLLKLGDVSLMMDCLSSGLDSKYTMSDMCMLAQYIVGCGYVPAGSSSRLRPRLSPRLFSEKYAQYAAYNSHR